MMVHMPYMKTLLYNSRVMCICCRPKCIGGILDRVACPPNTANTQSISNTVSTTTPPTHEITNLYPEFFHLYKNKSYIY